mmetsp:Transcript_26831/g.47705  ORF Transcript_26831/g.47705 Transcript_26831/m.47705 type:complete len:295 (+) Transcript_26831:147-1031(+)
MDLTGVQHHLARIRQHPVSSDHDWVGLDSNLYSLPNAHYHLVLHGCHPDLHAIALRDDWIHERNDFTLLGVHVGRHQGVGECQLHHGLKDLAEERLHAKWVLCLRQNLQQLIVGEEIKARERATLCLEVVIQTLLDQIQVVVAVDPNLEEPFRGALSQSVPVGVDAAHHLPPLAIHELELLPLSGELLHDIGRIENGLEIHPGPLNFQPLVETFRDVVKLLVPLVDLFLERLVERGELHRLCDHDLLIKNSHHLVSTLQDVSLRCTVGLAAVEEDLLPSHLHVLELVLDRLLLA